MFHEIVREVCSRYNFLFADNMELLGAGVSLFSCPRVLRFRVP